MPALADWCFVDMLEDDGEIRRVEVAHADPSRAADAELLRGYPPDRRAEEGIARVLRTGVPELIREMSDSRLPAITRDAHHQAIVQSLGVSLGDPGAAAGAGPDARRHLAALHGPEPALRRHRPGAGRGAWAALRGGRRQRPPLRRGPAGDPRPRRVPLDRLARAPNAADRHQGVRPDPAAGAGAGPARRRAPPPLAGDDRRRGRSPGGAGGRPAGRLADPDRPPAAAPLDRRPGGDAARGDGPLPRPPGRRSTLSRSSYRTGRSRSRWTWTAWNRSSRTCSQQRR